MMESAASMNIERSSLPATVALSAQLFLGISRSSVVLLNPDTKVAIHYDIHQLTTS